jgi:N-acetyl sugar amidotransferase
MKHTENRNEILKRISPRHPYQMCTRTVMDTTDPAITFNEDGVCNHVLDYEEYVRNSKPDPEASKFLMNQMVSNLRKEGDGKDYDCILGLSGGVDSSYVAWYVSQILGLRPLIVHIDAGWNNEIAVSNIQNIVQKLNLDLHTLVIDWNVIKDLQVAYFKSSLANIDIPQDHAFIACLYEEARKYNIRYIINGNNMATESILPTTWGYDASDSIQIKSIHKMFGSRPLKGYPLFSVFKKYILYPRILRIRTYSPLDWINYNKQEAKTFMTKELGWRDYGGKHYESKFTKFFQAHYLPEKFGYDKRKAHLSSLIVSGQLSREEALEELKQPLYNPIELQEDRDYFVKKLGITLEEYERIMQLPVHSYSEFPNSEVYMDKLRKYYHPIKRIANWIAK